MSAVTLTPPKATPEESKTERIPPDRAGAGLADLQEISAPRDYTALQLHKLHGLLSGHFEFVRNNLDVLSSPEPAQRMFLGAVDTEVPKNADPHLSHRLAMSLCRYEMEETNGMLIERAVRLLNLDIHRIDSSLDDNHLFTALKVCLEYKSDPDKFPQEPFSDPVFLARNDFSLLQGNVLTTMLIRLEQKDSDEPQLAGLLADLKKREDLFTVFSDLGSIPAARPEIQQALLRRSEDMLQKPPLL